MNEGDLTRSVGAPGAALRFAPSPISSGLTPFAQAMNAILSRGMASSSTSTISSWLTSCRARPRRASGCGASEAHRLRLLPCPGRRRCWLSLSPSQVACEGVPLAGGRGSLCALQHRGRGPAGGGHGASRAFKPGRPPIPLEDALAEAPRALLFVSQDRRFLTRLCATEWRLTPKGGEVRARGGAGRALPADRRRVGRATGRGSPLAQSATSAATRRPRSARVHTG